MDEKKEVAPSGRWFVGIEIHPGRGFLI